MMLTIPSCLKNVHEMLRRNNIQPPSCIRCIVFRKERLSSQGRQRGTINSLSLWKYLDSLKNMFVERSTQHTSFSSRKQPATAASEHKQITENASVSSSVASRESPPFS